MHNLQLGHNNVARCFKGSENRQNSTNYKRHLVRMSATRRSLRI